ncbi:MAG: hypothetical protein ABFE13_27020 [Phycisphaerales bacterium]
MRGILRGFKWTWVLNTYSVLFLTVALSFWLGRRVEEMHRASRATSCVWVGCMGILLGLWLYSHKRGGWQAIEPPAEVFLFWFLLLMAVLGVFIFSM